jgi:hypothetical protein
MAVKKWIWSNFMAAVIKWTFLVPHLVVVKAWGSPLGTAANVIQDQGDSPPKPIM